MFPHTTLASSRISRFLLYFSRFPPRQKEGGNGDGGGRGGKRGKRLDDPYGLDAKIKTKADLERELRKAMKANDVGKIEYLIDMARARGYGSQVTLVDVVAVNVVDVVVGVVVIFTFSLYPGPDRVEVG